MNRSSLKSLYENIDIKLAKTEKKFHHNFNFRFSPREFEFSKNYLKKNFDIDYKKKYAILHVRDNSVDKSKELSSIMRNSNIDNYNLAINKLIKSGYKVIRLGEKESNKNNLIKSNLNNNYIEYCYSKLKLPIIDLFLIQNADIILGTQSGVVETGSLFPNVKILTTNMLPNTLYWSPRKKYDLGIFKNVEIKGTKLNLYDQFDYFLPNIKKNFSNYEVPENVQIIENTPEEILFLVEEGLESKCTLDQLNFNKHKNYKFLEKINDLKLKNCINQIEYNQLYFHFITPEGSIANFQILKKN